MPFDSKTLPIELSSLIPGQVRVSWRIAGVTGSGSWLHPDDRPMLQTWCDDLNGKYGAGSHWIESGEG